MMNQYHKAKEACGDALLLFRMGDFYELFFDDAKIAAQKLGLTLTSRDKGENAIPMAGFPHHQLDAYLSKLVQSGTRVAICEQVEDAKKAKGLVKREITQLVTPGTVTDQGLLDPKSSNFLAAIYAQKTIVENSQIGVAWLEISTGEFWTAQLEFRHACDLLSRIQPAEILITESNNNDLVKTIATGSITVVPDWSFNYKIALEKLLGQFKVADLGGFGIDSEQRESICAAGAIIQYVFDTQQSSLEHIDRLLPYREGNYVEIDQATWRSLEIASTLRNNSREGSLFSILDQSITSMGSRKLLQWLSRPLICEVEIKRRQDAIEQLLRESRTRKTIRKFLRGIHDVQRLVAKVSTGRISPRDMRHICLSLDKLPDLKTNLKQCEADLLAEIETGLDTCPELQQSLDRAINDDAPVNTRDGGYLRDGFNQQLDDLRDLSRGGKQWLADYQAKISSESGIGGLKVGYNKVFGYYLEITNAHKDKVPDFFIRKQTLKNAERYITPELKDHEEKILSANEKADQLEFELFEQLRELAKGYLLQLKTNAELLAQLDALAGLAEVAEQRNYCRPELSSDGMLEIRDGRHPVLDVLEPSGKFIPNDTDLSNENGFLMLITGPNMAGKSTYIRQVALMTLMAQVGSFVPAKSAKIGIVDRIFARVGASDELSKGQSTFMVEMTETARILNTATNQSLVILDEIGRGTSTYDGVSLAWAIVEFLHDHIGCRTLFATHYHELTELEGTLPGLRNYNVDVKEWQDTIVFLHKIVAGAADRSYGIHVATLAGVPESVNRRASQILEQLQSQQEGEVIIRSEKSDQNSNGEIQLTLFGPTSHPLIEKIQRLDTNQVTPMDALSMLHEWKSELDSETGEPAAEKPVTEKSV